ncbi:MAG: DinB family protein [Flavobacterium sp.]|nr:MAG: DinB family protein [Flavobacterium sp.]
MKTAIAKLHQLLSQTERYFESADEIRLREATETGKWSRKQILGHLIDSAINNLTRFTEIGYQPQPYVYREYNQAELVHINNYQEMQTFELLGLWSSLNKQIARVMESATDERLKLKIVFPNGESSDLRFIMTDYPDHIEHHIKQILS